MIYRDLSYPDYAALPGARSTILKYMSRSPAHAREAMENPAPSTPAQVLGIAAHTATLEPDRWAAEVVVAPKVDRRTKAGKEAWEAFQAQPAGRLALTQDQADTARRIADAVLSHLEARHLIEHSAHEVSVLDGDTKARIDCYHSTYLADLKTTADASPSAFSNAVARYGYHLQAAMHSEVADAADPQERDWYWIAVETAAPYGVAVYQAHPQTLRRGAELYHQALVEWRACMASGVWPAYPAEPQMLVLPRWAWNLEEEL